MWVGGKSSVPPAVHRVWYSAEHGLGCVPSCVAGFSAPGSHFVLEGKLRPLLEISPQTRLTPNVPSTDPGILKTVFLRPQVLTSKVNTTDTFITSWHSHPKPIFPQSHCLPNRQFNLPAVYAGKTTTPRMICAQADSQKNPCSFKLRAFLCHWLSRRRSHRRSVAVIGWQLLLLKIPEEATKPA